MQQIDTQFIETVYDHYKKHGRDLPWRHLSDDPTMRFYQVLVSEIMLQQTQVARVVTKYDEWMDAYPRLDDAALVPLIDILSHWQGLGYNRRGKYLHDALKYIYLHGIPSDMPGLIALPGIGVNTAGAVLAYAFNFPVAYIETNIRTVYMHHYFSGQSSIHDSQIIPIIERTLDTRAPRHWYWALMDYGSYLKKSVRINDQSAHYVRQSAFIGSMRELRARVVRLLVDGPKTEQQLSSTLDDTRLNQCISALQKDGLIEFAMGHYRISE